MEDAAIQGQFRNELPQGARLSALMRNKSAGGASQVAYGTQAESASATPAGSGVARVSQSTAGSGTSASARSSATPAQTVTAPVKSFAVQMGEILDNAVNGGEYTIQIDKDISIGPQTLSFDGMKVTLRIEGIGSVRTITRSKYDAGAFTIERGVTLVLGNNIILQGYMPSNDPTIRSLIYVNTGGTLIMSGNSKIVGNKAITSGGGAFPSTYKTGGAVQINGGTFIMRDNTSLSENIGLGGAVMVDRG